MELPTETRIAAKSLSILVVDDDRVDAQWIERGLRRSGERDIRRATSLAEARRALADRHVDVILLDLVLPDGRGVGNVEDVLRHASVPIVVLTGLDDEDAAIAAMSLGAQDYLVKGHLDERALVKSIRFSTERHRLLRELDIASKRESAIKDELLSHVSHELRTPLTAIMQFVTILRDGIAGDVNDEQDEYLGVIERNAHQLKKMISTLMDVTRAASGKLTCRPMCVELGPLLDLAVTSFDRKAAEKDISIVVEDVEMPEIVADPHRIGQVLANLLENALKFSPSGSQIRVGVETGSDGREAVVSVTDQGRGVPPEDVERVFGRLYQSAGQSDVCRKGLGLGLHICSEIIALHGGRIWVENGPEAGACFRFALPRFSLREAVRRVICADGAIEPAIALLHVSVQAVSGPARAKGVDAIADQVARLVGTCMIGRSDSVLPLRPARGHRLEIFALARTGRDGVEAIAARVREEVRKERSIVPFGFDVRVGSRVVETVVAGPKDAVLTAATDEIAILTARLAAETHR